MSDTKPPTALTEVTLSDSTRSQVERAATDLDIRAPARQIGAVLARFLPPDAHDALIAFRQAQDGGVLLMHGVGPGEVPPQAECYTDLPVAPALLLGIVSLVATPAYAADEWDGAAITDIKVTSGFEETVSSRGRRGLPLHQESQHLEHPPDGLALLMVRGGGPTRIAPTIDVIRRMRVREMTTALATLRRAEFTHNMPASFGGGGGVTCPIPVLFAPDDMPELRVDLATTNATSGAADTALAELAAAADEIAFDVSLTPGDLILIDNRRWLHGRGELKSAMTDRWLIRSLFVCDSWSVQRESDPDEARGIMICS